MTAATRTLRGRGGSRELMALCAFATGLALAIQISSIDLDAVGGAALAGVVATLVLASARPELSVLLSLGLFADALYFGTYGFTLPAGQLVPLDVIFLGWWAL